VRAPAHVIEQFAAIIARVEAGESVRRICDKPGMPTRNEFRRAMRDDPVLMDRYLAVKGSVRLGRPRIAVAGERLEVAERIVDRVRAGLSLRAACAVKPRIVSVYQMQENFRRNPVLRQTYLAASKRSRPPKPAKPAKPANPVDPNIVETVIAAVAAGELLRVACATRGIKEHQFHFLLMKNSHYRSDWIAAKAMGREVRLARGPLRYASEIIALIENGSTAKQALASDCRFPHPATFRNALDTDAVLRARYDAALAKLTSTHRFIQRFDEIARRIESGEGIHEILGSSSKFPAYSGFRKFLSESPEHDCRYRAAHRVRQAGPNARDHGAKYSTAELRRAAVDLLLDERREIWNKRITPHGPKVTTLKLAASRDPDLRATVDHAILTRRHRLGIKAGPRFIPSSEVTLIAPPSKAIKIPTLRSLPGERFAVSLSGNELWRLAIAAIPKGLDVDVRNDVAADIVAAVLSGDLSPNQIALEAKRFLRAHNRKFSQFEFASLDKSVAFDSTLSFVDTLSSDAWEYP
jgi:hypothetical protein